MKIICEKCGAEITVNGLGRKRVLASVFIVLDAYKQYGSVRAVARKLNLPPGTVWGYLKREGVLKNAK